MNSYEPRDHQVSGKDVCCAWALSVIAAAGFLFLVSFLF